MFQEDKSGVCSESGRKRNGVCETVFKNLYSHMNLKIKKKVTCRKKNKMLMLLNEMNDFEKSSYISIFLYKLPQYV